MPIRLLFFGNGGPALGWLVGWQAASPPSEDGSDLLAAAQGAAEQVGR